MPDLPFGFGKIPLPQRIKVITAMQDLGFKQFPLASSLLLLSLMGLRSNLLHFRHCLLFSVFENLYSLDVSRSVNQVKVGAIKLWMQHYRLGCEFEASCRATFSAYSATAASSLSLFSSPLSFSLNEVEPNNLMKLS